MFTLVSYILSLIFLNEVRFSNIFFEKRISHFRKALQQLGFSVVLFLEDSRKLQKSPSIILAQRRYLNTYF